ncbi:hypothetical protein DICVIV_03885 [Dictyocaulus viviparus]|uniref:Uncharacterized protein n=1 Tax=Dictyocaulus viviparus TaxID=29172 RepID=A0A0D8XZ64_DICVI|nr:hypothetical protein DICVIV_03885 [Dictyocaulus viviparus]
MSIAFNHQNSSCVSKTFHKTLLTMVSQHPNQICRNTQGLGGPIGSTLSSLQSSAWYYLHLLYSLLYFFIEIFMNLRVSYVYVFTF